ncbi:MAG: hypothetical protein EOO50_00665 [Flavobacterium sp.]|uniref:hypothetical protein n=1 Tax=Flavobacterium sp. TaxID=239 RepID=UPI0011F5C869|nr:hypothetical protein [Flavobacterium sp.]RZJ68723.1 MAG: hypothetical protein EOO50_00665 [Flavobacterium sp.]
MKILYLPLLFALFCQCATNEKTGIVYAGKFEILNKRATSERWNALLLKNGFDKTLQTLKIRKARDPETEQTFYYLFGETADNSFKIATILSREKNYFYLPKNPEYVTCNCLEGSPMRVGNRWICETQGEEECEETIVAAK